MLSQELVTADRPEVDSRSPVHPPVARAAETEEQGVLWQPRPGAHISPVGEGAPDRCSFLPSHHCWCQGRRRGETWIIIAGYSGNTGGAEAVRDLGRAASWGFHGDQQIALGILALSLDQV